MDSSNRHALLHPGAGSGRLRAALGRLWAAPGRLQGRQPLAPTAEVWPSSIRSLASLSHFAQALPPQSASNKNSFVILCLGDSSDSTQS